MLDRLKREAVEFFENKQNRIIVISTITIIFLQIIALDYKNYDQYTKPHKVVLIINLLVLLCSMLLLKSKEKYKKVEECYVATTVALFAIVLLKMQVPKDQFDVLVIVMVPYSLYTFYIMSQNKFGLHEE